MVRHEVRFEADCTVALKGIVGDPTIVYRLDLVSLRNHNLQQDLANEIDKVARPVIEQRAIEKYHHENERDGVYIPQTRKFRLSGTMQISLVPSLTD